MSLRDNGVPTDQEMIAVRLDALSQALLSATNQLCCIRTPNLIEHAIPYHAMPFWFTGELFQFSTHFTTSVIFSVPNGQTGVITSISVGEHQAGIMTGTRISLLINGGATPAFPRVSGLLGLGTGNPRQTWIPIPDAAEVSLLIDCPWVINTFSGTPLEFGVPFSIAGYFLDDGYFDQTLNNSAAPQPTIPGADQYPSSYVNVQIPEANIASTTS